MDKEKEMGERSEKRRGKKKEEGRWRETREKAEEERELEEEGRADGKLRQNQGRCCGHSPGAVSALPPLAANYGHSWVGQKRTCGV